MLYFLDKSVFDDVLTPIVDEINHLIDNGIEDQGLGNVKVKVLNTVHDNLGANTLIGMVQSFSAMYYCRICVANKDQCQTMVEEDESLLRKDVLQGIEEYIAELNDPNQQWNVQDTKGFKKISELHRLHGFEIETCTGVDGFHELDEGVIQLGLGRGYSHLRTKGISESSLIEEVNCYDYGPLNNSHKPSNLKIYSDKLGMSGTQKRTLLLHFPFIHGHHFKTKEDKKILQTILDLITITRIVYKPTVLMSDYQLLKNVLKKHLTDVKHLFDANLTPKYHFLIHYPRMLLRFGPLWLMNSLPYESKHKFFTQTVKHIGISQNVLKTLVIRHQCAQAVKFERGLKHELILGKKK